MSSIKSVTMDNHAIETRFKMGMTQWQQCMTTVRDRDAYLFQNDMWTDCKFLVGDVEKQEFSCHALHLAKSSPAFAAMLFGEINDRGRVVIVPDVTPAAFSALLQYIYEGVLQKLNLEVACDLLYAAKKYLMPVPFLSLIRSMLCMHINLQQVWYILEFARNHDEPELEGTAWHFALENAGDALKSESLLCVDQSTLMLLVQHDYMNVKSESQVYQACVDWAVHQEVETETFPCQKVSELSLFQKPTGIVSTKACKLLKPFLKHIRFLTMSHKEFTQGPGKGKVLTSNECNTITKYLKTSVLERELPNLCNNIEKRKKFNHFYALAASKTDLPVTAEKYRKYSFNNSVYAEFTSKNTQLGVQIPTQVKQVDSHSDTYKEEMTIIVYNVCDEKVIHATRFTEIVEYDTIVNVPYAEPLVSNGKYEVFQISIIFHTSGFYPCSLESEISSITKVDQIDDIHANFVKEGDFKYILYVIEEMEGNVSSLFESLNGSI